MSVKHCTLLIYEFHYCISHLPVQHLSLLCIKAHRVQIPAGARLRANGAQAAYPHCSVLFSRTGHHAQHRAPGIPTSYSYLPASPWHSPAFPCQAAEGGGCRSRLELPLPAPMFRNPVWIKQGELDGMRQGRLHQALASKGKGKHTFVED